MIIYLPNIKARQDFARATQLKTVFCNRGSLEKHASTYFLHIIQLKFELRLPIVAVKHKQLLLVFLLYDYRNIIVINTYLYAVTCKIVCYNLKTFWFVN